MNISAITRRESLKADIVKSLSILTDREAAVLYLYFGINRDHTLTLEEIGSKFKLTRERVRQIKDKALKKVEGRANRK